MLEREVFKLLLSPAGQPGGQWAGELREGRRGSADAVGLLGNCRWAIGLGSGQKEFYRKVDGTGLALG